MTRAQRAEAFSRRVRGAVVSGVLIGGVLAPPVTAAPVVTDANSIVAGAVSDDGSRVTAVERMDDRNIRLQVRSAAMDQTFPVEVQRPADTTAPRPSLYLLSGAGGGVDGESWQAQSDVRRFLADKNVNLILPLGGKFSYYTDWRTDDPVLGRNKWRTYLTRELPTLIDRTLGTDGVNALAGISTSATTVLTLPIAAPGLYRAIGSYSGCVQTSDPIGSRFVRLAVAWGGGNADNMWGPADSPEWARNDPYLHADRLRGLALYMSSGNGIPGKYDTLGGPHALPGPDGLADQVMLGGLIEAATNYCTHNMKSRLDALGIPATYDFSTGTHSWGYWGDELKRSWPVLARGLGLD